MLSICNIRLDIYIKKNINNNIQYVLLYYIMYCVFTSLFTMYNKIIYFVLPSNWFQLLMKSLEFKTCPY